MELYDIAATPYENDDLKVEKPDVVKRLLGKLKAWQTTLPAKPVGNVFSAKRK